MTIRTKAALLALCPDNTAGMIAPSCLRDIMDSVCEWMRPVGSLYETTVDENPAVTFGFGTWVRVAVGQVLVGVDANDVDFNAAGKTGGAKTVTLTEAQIPAHTHVQNSHNHTQDAHTHVQNSHAHGEQLQGGTSGTNTGTHLMGSASTGGNLRTAGQSTLGVVAVNQNATATNQAATAVNQNTGGGQAHNNMPPFYAAYIWRRTA